MACVVFVWSFFGGIISYLYTGVPILYGYLFDAGFNCGLEKDGFCLSNDRWGVLRIVIFYPWAELGLIYPFPGFWCENRQGGNYEELIWNIFFVCFFGGYFSIRLEGPLWLAFQ